MRVTEFSLDRIVKYDFSMGQWRAGPDAPEGYENGQFIPQEDIKYDPDTGKQSPAYPPGGNIGRSRGMRKYWNDVARTRRLQEDITVEIDDEEITLQPSNINDARQLVKLYRNQLDKLKEGEISQDEFDQFIRETFDSP